MFLRSRAEQARTRQMRFVVIGAGAIGGLVGARLFQAEHHVTLVARGEHGEALTKGICIEAPSAQPVRLPVPAVTDVNQVDWTDETVILLGVKGQDTDAALDRLCVVAHPDTPIVCMQNGVVNERQALRRFNRVYAMCVITGATQSAPGVIRARSSPITGILDIGRYETGLDELSQEIAHALCESSFSSIARADIMRWKYRKLVVNLVNAIEALCGPRAARQSRLARQARQEGERVLQAARIEAASSLEYFLRRAGATEASQVTEGSMEGGSTWQSLKRGNRSTEVANLNGEIALLGALHGVPTPINSALQRLVLSTALRGDGPGTWDLRDLSAVVGVAYP
jgi:2-dehydropantoate 2-reductase